MTTTSAHTVNTYPIGSGRTEEIYMNGELIGYVTGTMMFIGEKAGGYKFESREAAIEACVSAATKGYWTGEVS